MVRAVALFALVCGATATLDASPFGNSVLAELETKLAAGTPLTELKSILQDIRTRLSEADAADVAAQGADSAYCTERTKKLTNDIQLEEQAIQSLNASINADKDVVTQMAALMASLTAEITQLEADKLENENEQAARTAERERQNDEFHKGKADSILCIDAIDEIQEMDFGMLRKNQGDDASHYQAGVRLTSMIEALSHKVTHPQVQSFVQLAALSMAAQQDGGDFDKLEALLQQLEDELKKYIEDITADEAALLRQHKKTMATLAKTHADIVRTIANKREEFNNASLKKEAAEARIQANTVEMHEAQASKAALVTELLDLRLGCSARETAHSTRRSERAEEGRTINKIEAILEEKLSKHFQDGGHLTSNITSN